MSRIIGAVALAVLALVSVPIYNLIDKGKPFHDLQQAQSVGNVLRDVELVNLDACRLKFKDQIESCETVRVIPGHPHLILMACGNLKQQRQWWPPAGLITPPSNETQLVNSQWYAVDLVSEQLISVPVTGKGPRSFIAHGFDISQSTVAAINHLPTGSVIDLYELSVKPSPALKYTRTLEHELLTTPNDLVIIPGAQQILVTMDHFYHKTQDKYQRLIEDFYLRPLTGVVACSWSANVTCHQFLDSIAYANGIALRDEKLYIGSTTTGNVLIYDVHQGKNGKQLTIQSEKYESINLRMAVDGLSLDTNGDLLAAGHPKAINYLVHAWQLQIPSQVAAWLQPSLRQLPHPAASFKPWSQVQRVYANQDEDQYYAVKWKSRTVLVDDAVDSDIQGSSSVAAGVGKQDKPRYVIGLLTGRGVAICSSL